MKIKNLFFDSLRDYNLNTFRADFNAGLNVALLAFPQGMAFALVVGLPIQYGIFGTAIAGLIGPFFASGRFISLGPTNATSVLLMGAFISMAASPQQMVQMLPLILLMGGIFMVAAYFLKAANLIQFISSSVVTGYITAAAVLIIANQLKIVLGIHFTEKPTTFIGIAIQTFQSAGQTHFPSLILGLVSFVLFWLLNKNLKKLPNVAIILLFMSAIGYGMNHFLEPFWHVATFPSFQASDWKLTLPAPSFERISQLGSIAMALSFLSVLEALSIGKSLAARAGETLDPNRELLSMGMANIGCAFFSGMPASGSLTRSTLNWTSGSKTPMSNILLGILCAIGAVSLGPLTHFIPKATLAALVIFLGASLVNANRIRIMLKTTQRDRIVFVATLFAALIFRLDTAIFMGTGLSIILFLRKAAMPELVEYTYGKQGTLKELPAGEMRVNPEISIVHVEGNLFFGAAELFRSQMRRICTEPNLVVVILKMRNALHLDATAALALEELIRFMEDQGRHLLISEVRPEVYRIFKASGILDVLKKDHIFMDAPENPNLSTAQAAERARHLIGKGKAKTSIYVNQS